MDEEKLQKLVGQMLNDLNGAASVAMVRMDDALALHETLGTSIRAVNDEIVDARIYAGFHYRYSTVLGSDLGKKVGAYVAQNSMQPLKGQTNNR